jgi:hypothetical protein
MMCRGSVVDAVSTFKIVTYINGLKIIDSPIKCAIYNMVCRRYVVEVVSTFKYVKLSHWLKLGKISVESQLVTSAAVHGFENYLTFIDPCIVIYSYSKTNQVHQFLKFIYSE